MSYIFQELSLLGCGAAAHLSYGRVAEVSSQVCPEVHRGLDFTKLASGVGEGY